MKKLQNVCKAENTYVKIQDLKKGKKYKISYFEQKDTKFGVSVMVKLENCNFVFLPARVGKLLLESDETLMEFNNQSACLVYLGQSVKDPQQAVIDITFNNSFDV